MPGWLNGVVGRSEAESEAWNEDWRSESGERRKVKFLINRALNISGYLVFQYPEIHKTLINKRLTLPGHLDGVVGRSEAESEAWNEDWRSESGERRKVKFLINRALNISGYLVFQYPEIHKTLINKRLTLPGHLDGVVGGSEAESEAWNEERNED